jgi:SWI/SNF-related matrix-associated actin-dependent regulator of chromatin subfamily A member 5
LYGKDADKKQKEEQKKIDSAVPLSDDDLKEKELLLTQGLSHWSRRDFQQFIKANEKYGRRDLDSISREMETKTPEQVLRYSFVNWDGWTIVVINIYSGARVCGDILATYRRA